MGKRKKCFLSWENEINIKNTECMTLNNIAKTNNHHPHVHSNNNNGSLVLTLRK